MFDQEEDDDLLIANKNFPGVKDRYFFKIPLNRNEEGMNPSLLSSVDPEFAREVMQGGPMETVREKLVHLIKTREDFYHSSHCRLEELERANALNCIHVMRNLLSERNERISRCSALDTLLELIGSNAIPFGRQAFFIDLLFILRGTLGRSGIYYLEEPSHPGAASYSPTEGRYSHLDDLAIRCLTRTASYPSGLDPSVVRSREKNKRRVLMALGGRESDWDDHLWHLQNVVKDTDLIKKVIELDPGEEAAISMANENHVPFGITPYYLSLMDPINDEGWDAAIRAQVIPKLDYLKVIIPARRRGGDELDFMQERLTTPTDLVARRYPLIAIFKPYNSCAQICSYCQRNWEIEGPMDPNALASSEQMELAFRWFEANPLVQEVLITGGDPLVMSDVMLERILTRFSGMRHIMRIRIGTRLPVVLPMRFTDNLVDILSRCNAPPERELCLVTHFEHPYEVTPESAASVRRLRGQGMMVYNQQVFTIENCRRFETVALRTALKQIGIDPYYLFNTKGKEETKHFRVPIARILQEIKEEARILPGIARTDEPVFNIPAFGKNHLRAWQHHDMLMITPEGERVYEFHPWEKNIALAPTYIYRDVPIIEFLERLAKRDEDPEEYRSIWYYF